MTPFATTSKTIRLALALTVLTPVPLLAQALTAREMLAQAQNQAYSSNVLSLGGISFPEPQLIAFLLALFLIPLLHFFLTRTYYGNGIRATAQVLSRVQRTESWFSEYQFRRILPLPSPAQLP